MPSTQKEIFYTATKPYSVLNKLTPQTKNVWLVCHGLGYLSKYFLHYFKGLNAEENYIIAPQAPNLYYQKNLKHVGACWLTKENTALEIENTMQYLDAVLTEENLPDNINLIVFGYSQGVSVATRYVKHSKLQCSQLVLHSGGIPKELVASDFEFLKAKVSLIYGTEDEYLDKDRITNETERANALFKNLTIIPFKGKHVVNVDIINKLVL